MIAITGSTGFIGSRLKEILEEKGHELYCPSRSQYYDPFTKVEKLFHLAAYGNHYNQSNIKEMFSVNILLTEHLLAHTDYNKFYNFSTSSVTLPVLTDYAMSKLWAECIASQYPNTVNIRPYSIYGEGEAYRRFIPTVIKHLLNGTEMPLAEGSVHDWLYVDDFINSLLEGETIIGSGEKHTNLEVVRMLEDISGKKLRYTKAKLRSYDNDNWVSPNTVKHIPLYEGLKKVYESISAKNS